MTMGPPNPLGAARRGRLRASDADREHVIEMLKAAFVQGRLTKDELDLRVGQTFVSRTYAELAALTADIPVGSALSAAAEARPGTGPAGPAAGEQEGKYVGPGRGSPHSRRHDRGGGHYRQ